MNKLLLFLHYMGFAITIGAALYDRFYLVRNIRIAKGSNLERDLIQIYLSTAPLFTVGVAFILMSGIGLTLIHRGGFFRLSTLGLKQFLFLMIGLLFPFYIIPIMFKIKRLLSTSANENQGVSDQCRALLKRLYFVLDFVTITNVLILAIAVATSHPGRTTYY
uniref:DUF2269 family protein n=1 Tax=Oscillatoriales cyanobacterium SpSt-402 TaxID=2282168 RepID=A0A832H487_9CYAN